MNLKHNITFLFLLFSGLLPLKANIRALTDSAANAFQQQQYATAIRYYEQILASGQSSSGLHYNLGNAYYRDNKLGKAIYHYELAKKLDPADEDISNNLRIVSSKTIDKIDVKENYFVSAVKSNLYTLLSTDGWAWLSIACIILAALFFVLYIQSASPVFKRTGFWAGSFFFISTAIVFCIGYAALQNKHRQTRAIITSAIVQVVSAPDAAGKTKFTLHEGTRVKVLESNSEWTGIQLDNGNEGWVKTTELGLF